MDDEWWEHQKDLTAQRVAQLERDPDDLASDEAHHVRTWRE